LCGASPWSAGLQQSADLSKDHCKIKYFLRKAEREKFKVMNISKEGFAFGQNISTAFNLNMRAIEQVKAVIVHTR